MGTGNGALNGEGFVQFALLQKDKKSICHTKCSNLPFKVPDCWSINDFRARSAYKELDLPQCQLYPVPESSREKTEWGIFMDYLTKRDKVGIVNMKSCIFYLLAPDERQKYTHINVLYKMREALHAVEMSGENFNEQRNSSDESNWTSSKMRRNWTTDDGSPVTRMSDSILGSSFVRTDPSYLVTLSQTHAGWAFGAIAELIDNSRDANAPRLAISVEHLYSRKVGKKIPVLSVVDDGIGMSHSDILTMLSFGHKQPEKENADRIGRFGIGFKTGAMKLGRDALVLTQTSGSRSVALLSQSYNEHKENLEIPIITYRKIGVFMEVDSNIQSEAFANTNMNAIKEFSPFNEYLLGERLGLFGEMGTGTQIYIWNLDKWGSDYSLEWVDSTTIVEGSLQPSHGDILIRSRRLRARPGQISKKVPLDYSLHAYLEVIFLDPRMKIYVQGSLVKCRPLAKSLNNTSVVKGTIMGKAIQLTLGRSHVEWELMNGGIFLYWHGRLIEAYKRVGGMVHNADIGRGVLGVVDVSDLMDDVKGQVWVLNNKQGFQDCEPYAKLEQWLGSKLDEYWDKHFDRVELDTGVKNHKPDHEWVQCDKCRKWRKLDTGFNGDSLPSEWFCYMPPFNGKCETPEQQLERGIITVGTKRSRCDDMQLIKKEEEIAVPAKNPHVENKQLSKIEEASPKAMIISPTKKGTPNHSSSRSSMVCKQSCEGDDYSEEDSSQPEDWNSPSKLKWARKGQRRTSRQL